MKNIIKKGYFYLFYIFFYNYTCNVKIIKKGITLKNQSNGKSSKRTKRNY